MKNNFPGLHILREMQKFAPAFIGVKPRLLIEGLAFVIGAAEPSSPV
jgi:hypothetical protein